MFSKIGVYPFTIDAYLCDFRGRATLPMLGNFMLRVATQHAEERGFGFNSMTEQKKVWVLSRMVVEIFEYPKNDSIIEVNTWISDVNKIFTERCFSFIDVEGKTLGYARSIWASIDLESRKPTNILEMEGLTDYNIGKPSPIEGMRKILPIKEIDPLTSFEVKYSDIDINTHLNSMKYIEHYVDLFDINLFKEKEISRFEINYLNEAYYGDTLNVYQKKESDNSYLLEMKNKETTVSLARITWK